MTTWDAYWESLANLECAERFGTPEQLAQAQDAAKDSLQACACLGGFLLLAALEDGTVRLQRKLGLVFGGLGREAHDRATTALNRIYDVEVRLRELEHRHEELSVSVSYSQDVREKAKQMGEESGLPLPLVTIDTGGMIYQGPVSHAAQRELTRFYLDFMAKHVEKGAGDGTGVAEKGKG